MRFLPDIRHDRARRPDVAQHGSEIGMKLTPRVVRQRPRVPRELGEAPDSFLRFSASLSSDRGEHFLGPPEEAPSLRTSHATAVGRVQGTGPSPAPGLTARRYFISHIISIAPRPSWNCGRGM